MNNMRPQCIPDENLRARKSFDVSHMESKGTILHLQRLSTEDGPGIRTTVFFKGCPLSCAWCHNPESIALEPQVQWLETRCIGCKSCLSACPQAALSWSGQGAVRNREACIVCGRCVELCPAGAHELLGRQVSAVKLIAELVKDRAYFERSGGGVTLSGGEPSLQAEFALALMRGLRERGISVALDTCGLCQTTTLQALVDASDLVMFDLKLADSDAHKRWTGAPNTRILENLRWLGRYLQTNTSKRLWVRTPLIPGATDSAANLGAIGAWLADNLPGQVERWELCAFNNLCRDKYTRLGMEWEFAGTALLSAVDLVQAGESARASGFDPQRVMVSGAARVE